jgi:hypothetical protein
MKNREKYLNITIYSSIVIFFLILSFFFIPFSDSLRSKLFIFAGILGLIFLILGILLLIFSRKEKGLLKRYLTITGISAISPLISVILHNLLYALSLIFENLEGILGVLGGAFFIWGLVGAPILYIVGMVGVVVSRKKGLK